VPDRDERSRRTVCVAFAGGWPVKGISTDLQSKVQLRSAELLKSKVGPWSIDWRHGGMEAWRHGGMEAWMGHE
jgi:hypothetical protein